ncbi:MAG: hypothetical protein OXN94_12760 [Chloroflexota bacterium]|nr:hypothetical protein [Chloroflexota bacterium]
MRGERISLELTGSDATAYALAASPGFAKDGFCFAATSGGLYRSTDGGDCWESLPIVEEQGAQMAATAVAVSPSFDQDRTVFAAVKGGILRSSDGGDTWFAAKFPAPPPLFTTLAISPYFAQDGLMLAGTMEDGVFSSTDRGVNWQPWNFGLFDLGVLCLAASPHLREDETILAGTETGLYRSTNGGRAWRESGFPSEFAPILSLAYAIGKDESLLFAGTEGKGLFISCDDGASWDRSAPNSLPGSVNQLQILYKPDGRAEIYALSEDGVLRSRDAGQNWEFLAGAEDPPTAFLVPDPSGEAMFLGLAGKGIVQYEL